MEVYTLDEIYGSLPRYQSERIKELVINHGEEKAAEIWLNSLGPKYTSHFGGELAVGKSSYFERCLAEIDKLVCGHPDYKEEQTKYIDYGKAFTIASATAIAAWLAPIVSISIVILVPAVELILHTILKVGFKAYCSNKTF